MPSDVTGLVGDGSGLIPAIENGEREPSEILESEDPIDLSETGIEGTEGMSCEVGGPRYEDKLEKAEDSSSKDVDESEGEDSVLKLWVGDCSGSSASSCSVCVPFCSGEGIEVIIGVM